MTPEYGAATQLEKIDMLDFADLIALNKFDKRGALDAIRDVKKQYKRNHNLWEAKDEDLPVFGTIASQFNDPGMNSLYRAVIDKIDEKTGANLNSNFASSEELSEKIYIIPPKRVRYLSEIAENNRSYDVWVDQQVEVASKLYALNESMLVLKDSEIESKDVLLKGLQKSYDKVALDLSPRTCVLLKNGPKKLNYTKRHFISLKLDQRN